MTVEELGQQIKQKYPQYSNYSDKEIGDKMLAKYPVYQSRITEPQASETQPKSSSESPFSPSNLPNIPVATQVAKFGLGFGQRIVDVGLGLGQAVSKGASAITKKVFGTSAGTEKVAENLGKIRESLSQPLAQSNQGKFADTLATGAGKLAGDVALLSSPTKAVSTGQQFLEGAVKGSKAIQALPSALRYGAGMLAHVAPEAALGAGYGLATSGGDTRQARNDAILFGVTSGLFKGATDVYQSLKGTLGQNVAKGLGMTGTKGVEQATGKIAQATNGLKVIGDNAAGETIKDINGVEKVFDPSKATYYDTLQAYKIARDKVYQNYTNIAKQAGDEGATFTAKDFNSVIKDLENTGDTTAAFKSKAASLINDIKQNFGKVNPVDGQTYFPNTDLLRIQDFIQNVNTDVNPLSDKAGAEISGKASQLMRKILDNKIEQATGEGYQLARNEYVSLKSIENNLVNQFKKVAPRMGKGWSSYIEGFGNLDLILSVFNNSPEQAARGIGMDVLAKIMTHFRDPEVNLRNAFNMINNKVYSNAAGRAFGLPTIK